MPSDNTVIVGDQKCDNNSGDICIDVPFDDNFIDEDEVPTNTSTNITISGFLVTRVKQKICFFCCFLFVELFVPREKVQKALTFTENMLKIIDFMTSR